MTQKKAKKENIAEEEEKETSKDDWYKIEREYHSKAHELESGKAEKFIYQI